MIRGRSIQPSPEPVRRRIGQFHRREPVGHLAMRELDVESLGGFAGIDGRFRQAGTDQQQARAVPAHRVVRDLGAGCAEAVLHVENRVGGAVLRSGDRVVVRHRDQARAEIDEGQDRRRRQFRDRM